MYCQILSMSFQSFTIPCSIGYLIVRSPLCSYWKYIHKVHHFKNSRSAYQNSLIYTPILNDLLINHLCLWTKEDISFQRPCHNPHMFGPSNTKIHSINKCTELVIVHIFNILHMFVYSKIHIEMKRGWTIFNLLTA